MFPRSGAFVRRGAFEERSLLPVSAACLVANGMREHLTQLCGADVDLRLWPPAIPQPGAWGEILRDARLYAMRGRQCDAAIVLRREDARMLALLLFGERVPDESRDLSPFESEIARRAVERIAVTLVPVCGDAALDPSLRIRAFVTYFELHVVKPLALCIGVALAREPASPHVPVLTRDHLARAVTSACVEIALAERSAVEVAAIKPGDLLVNTRARALLRVNGSVVAQGACGVASHRYAFAMEARA